MHAVIMAGGKGTRLNSVSTEIPKPMFKILGKPILQYQIESLKKSGINEITLVVGYLKDIIIEYFGDGHDFNVKINYIEETEPLGTAGALYYLKDEKEDFILLFGDLILDIDFNRFMVFHKKHKSEITLFGHPNSHPFDSDIIERDNSNKVIKIHKKNILRDFYYCNFVNAGIYCINPKAIKYINSPHKIDLEKELISEKIKEGKVYAYKSTEYVKDMGTPDRLVSVTEDLQNNIVSGRNLNYTQKAIFLDRDGTINKYIGFLRDINKFELINGVSRAIAKINKSPYLAIIATNQPVIARGEVSFEQINEIHKKMETELGKFGAYIDDIYFCPHHPDKGYKGEISELKIECNCRKPKIGMIKDAVNKYNIDLSKSWYIGDTTVDIQTGKNAGMKTILVLTGEAGLDNKYEVKSDFVADNLLDAVNYILKKGE